MDVLASYRPNRDRRDDQPHSLEHRSQLQPALLERSGVADRQPHQAGPDARLLEFFVRHLAAGRGRRARHQRLAVAQAHRHQAELVFVLQQAHELERASRDAEVEREDSAVAEIRVRQLLSARRGPGDSRGPGRSPATPARRAASRWHAPCDCAPPCAGPGAAAAG